MILKTETQVKDLIAAINQCEGDVHLKEMVGDDCIQDYNLKSVMSMYAGIGALCDKNGKGDALELYCDKHSDEGYLIDFFVKYPDAA